MKARVQSSRDKEIFIKLFDSKYNSALWYLGLLNNKEFQKMLKNELKKIPSHDNIQRQLSHAEIISGSGNLNESPTKHLRIRLNSRDYQTENPI